MDVALFYVPVSAKLFRKRVSGMKSILCINTCNYFRSSLLTSYVLAGLRKPLNSNQSAPPHKISGPGHPVAGAHTNGFPEDIHPCGFNSIDVLNMQSELKNFAFKIGS